jgi:hypothetical protein
MRLRHAILVGLVLASSAAADEFDLYTNSVLGKVAATDGARQVDKLSLADLQRTPQVLAQHDGCLVIVRTDEANWAKLVVRQALRKQGDAEEPILVVQRYQTLRAGTESGRQAAGKSVYMFDGQQLNLDIGQVVPDGRGGDIEFRRDGDKDAVLRPVGKAKFYVVSKPLVSARPAAGGPSPGPVVPEDFSGKYRLIANGQWSGRLALDVTEGGEVTGSYVSDQTGGDYPVKGSIGKQPHHIRFNVELPATRLEFDGRLWTRGKGALSGTVTLTGREFGFVAVRDGAELMPKEEE